jgi:RHS repeat-associated protein
MPENNAEIGRRKAQRWLVGICAFLGYMAVGHQFGFTFPGDVFMSATPAQAPSSDDKRVSEEATHEVDESGAARYTIPITVPPGRQGMQPKLALSYSSRNAVRGGIAVGWVLSIPRIELDSSQGLLAGTSYRSTISGTRLVAVPGSTNAEVEDFRAESDTSYARYERLKSSAAPNFNYIWRMRTTDGRTWFFGDRPTANELATPTLVGRSFLTRVIDKFGNSMEYFYQTAGGRGPIQLGFTGRRADTYLDRIEWGKNEAAGIMQHHAAAVFVYADDPPEYDLVRKGFCPGSNVPIGASFTYRLGYPLYEGAKRLVGIRLEVSENGTWPGREVRRYELTYDESELSCPTGMTHAPLRLLTGVREIATNRDKSLIVLPHNFEYGRRELELTQTASASTFGTSGGSGENVNSPNKSGRWPTLTSLSLDFDGNGRLDGIGNDLSARGPNGDLTHCTVGGIALPIVPWANALPGQFGTRNNFQPTSSFTASQDYSIPREWCSASHQFSRVEGRLVVGPNGEKRSEGAVPDDERSQEGPATYLSYRFMDVTGDGRPDLVTAIDTNRGRYHPESDARLWPPSVQRPACVDRGPCINGMCNVMLTSPVNAAKYLYPPMAPRVAAPSPVQPVSRSIPGPESTGPRIWYRAVHPRVLIGDMAYAAGFWATCDHRPDCPPGKLYHFGDEPDPEEYDRQQEAAKSAQWPEFYCGRYVLRVYENTGKGFASQARIIYSPIPIETDRATSDLGNGHLAAASSWHGFLDIDGDGLLDAVYRSPNAGGALVKPFEVFRGDGTGNFVNDRAQGTSYLWPAPIVDSLGVRIKLQGDGDTMTSYHSPNESHTKSSGTKVTIQDLNGDGLPDYITSGDGQPQIRVYYNTGTGFVRDQHLLETPAWGTEKYGRFEENHSFVLATPASGTNAIAKNHIWSRAVTRVLDVDADGLPDMVRIQPPVYSRPDACLGSLAQPLVRVFINVGDKLVPMGETANLKKWWHALARITVGGPETRWNVVTDFADVDGDGLPEAQYMAGDLAGCPQDIFTSAKDGQGLRLLRRVTNGRGGSVQFDYQSRRPQAAGPSPGGISSGGMIQPRAVSAQTEGRVPFPVWVVSKVTANAGPDALRNPSPKTETQYDYQQAVYNQDNHGDWGFRGFGYVWIKSPSGAVTDTTYDHTLHWGGLPVSVRTFDAQGGHPHRVTKTVWGRYTLFNNAIVTHHRQEVETRTCGQTQTLADCEANGAPRFEISKWLPITQTNKTSTDPPVPQLYTEAIRYVSEQRNVNPPAPNTKWREIKPQLLNTPTDYRLVTGEELRWVMGAQPVWVGRTVHNYDPALRFEARTDEYADATTVATTVRTPDPAGNIETVMQPNEVGKAARVTHFVYDIRKLFVVQTINELNHIVDSSYDLGTGVQLSSRGPNAKGTVKDGWERKMDGLGRIREEFVYLDHPTSGYVPLLMTRNTYFEGPELNGHAGVITWRRIELDQDRWTQTLTEIDGLGRIVASTVSNHTGAPVLSVSRYYYDAAGKLAKAELPSPIQTPGPSTVAYTLAYDAQGRPASALRPDQTGQRWTYDGRWTTREDVIGNQGGVVSRTRTRTDAWDRMVETGEQLVNNWGLTRYEYDGNDNVWRITNADGMGTELQHDWLSRRIIVTKGGQTWRYGYDLNGNMTSIIAPSGSANPANYTTTMTYDPLDRPLTRISGSRGLTPEQLDRFESTTASYAYDTGENGKGRLRTITQTSSKVTTFTYDARGLVVGEERTFTIPNKQFPEKRKLLRTYNALGQPATVTYPDGPVPSESTAIRYMYDDRGLPSQVTWLNQNLQLGQATFTAAGKLATRKGPLSPTVTHQMAYRYDDLGRILRLHMTTARNGQPTSDTLIDQRYAYTGSDDVASMNTTLGVTPQPVLNGWKFEYDKQHQLTRAAGPLNYLATFTYSPAGRVLSADVNAAPEAARVHRRRVTYDYRDGDPEAPDKLIDPATNAAWVSLVYDAAGNVTQRKIQGQTNPWIHVYDGADLQREVLAPDGTSEAYWYDHERQRSLVVSKGANGTVQRVRWVFRDTEIWYDGTGKIVRTIANVPFNGTFARIEDRTKVRLLFANTRGDILLALDQGQSAPTAEFAYGPYGESLQEGGNDSVNVLERFNGKQRDAGSGLSYYGYRYFDERSLTWTQADPLYRFAPDISKHYPRRFVTYAFSLNNPLRYVDLDGRDGASVGASATKEGSLVNKTIINASGNLSGTVQLASVGAGVKLSPQESSVNVQAKLAQASFKVEAGGMSHAAKVSVATVEAGVGYSAKGAHLSGEASLAKGTFESERNYGFVTLTAGVTFTVGVEGKVAAGPNGLAIGVAAGHGYSVEVSPNWDVSAEEALEGAKELLLDIGGIGPFSLGGAIDWLSESGDSSAPPRDVRKECIAKGNEGGCFPALE